MRRENAALVRCTRQYREDTSMAKRTTLRSRSGKKLYAVRDKGGKFKDIQSYQKAHSMDMKRKSKAEVAKKKTKKKAKKKAKRSR